MEETADLSGIDGAVHRDSCVWPDVVEACPQSRYVVGRILDVIVDRGVVAESPVEKEELPVVTDVSVILRADNLDLGMVEEVGNLRIPVQIHPEPVDLIDEAGDCLLQDVGPLPERSHPGKHATVLRHGTAFPTGSVPVKTTAIGAPGARKRAVSGSGGRASLANHARDDFSGLINCAPSIGSAFRAPLASTSIPWIPVIGRRSPRDATCSSTR